MCYQEVETEKLYYGFPIVLIGYQDEVNGYNFTTLSSTYSLGDMMTVGIYRFGCAIEQIKKHGCFTINVPTKSLMKEIEIGGFNSGVDKFELADLSYTVSKKINAPIIKDCMVVIECEVTQIVELDEFSDYSNIVAKIKGRFINETIMGAAVVAPELLSPVLFVGDAFGRGYRYVDDKMDKLGDFFKKRK